MNRLNFIFLIAFLFCVLNFVHVFGIDNSELGPGEQCELKDNQIGTCQQVANCDYAKKLISENRRSELSRCAFQGSTYYICCPNNFPTSNDYPKSKKFEKALCKGVHHAQDLSINIISGESTNPGEFPFQVALGYRNQNGEIKYNCGGALIADDIVLTATHCANRKNAIPVTVKLGRASLIPDEHDYYSGEDIEIESIKIHPNYTRKTRHNDIAIIKLKEPTKFTLPIQTVCLAPDDSFLNSETNLTITGFGRNDVDTQKTSDWLLKATVNLYPVEKCNDIVKIDSKVVVESQFCAMGYKGADACQGDSGGPVSYIKDSGHYLYGIVSYGIACGGASPGIYTKVHQHFEWLDNEMYKFEQNS